MLKKLAVYKCIQDFKKASGNLHAQISKKFNVAISKTSLLISKRWKEQIKNGIYKFKSDLTDFRKGHNQKNTYIFQCASSRFPSRRMKSFQTNVLRLHKKRQMQMQQMLQMQTYKKEVS